MAPAPFCRCSGCRRRTPPPVDLGPLLYCLLTERAFTAWRSPPYKDPMRWLPALLLVALAGGLGAFWWLEPADAPPPAAGARAVDEHAAPADPGAPAEASLPPFDEHVPAAAVEADADPEPAAERSDGALAEPGPVGARVVVVRGAPPVPVAGAELFFLGERDLERTNRGQPFAIDRFEGPERFGQRRVADANGEVRLPAVRDRLLCAARADGEFGFAIAHPRARELTIALAPDEQIVVEATFAGGGPAEVPIAIVQQQVAADDRQRGEANAIWSGATGRDGRARVRHFQLLRADPPGGPGQPDGRAPTDERFAAIAKVPCDPPVFAEFAGRPAIAEPVRLVLPPLGRLEVTLVDHQGRRLLSPALVGFGTRGGGFDGTPLRVNRWLTSQRADKPAGDRPVMLPFAPVDQPVMVYARYPDERRAARSAPLSGPTKPGDTLAIAVPLLPEHTVLAGRLLLAERRPLADGRAEASLWRGDRLLRTLTVRTIADGRFDVVLTGDGDATPCQLDVRLSPSPSAEGASGATLGARVPLPPWPPGQRVELGDLVLAPLPQVVHGVVVDDRGEAVPDASVAVLQAPPDTAGNDEAARRGREPWRAVPGLAATTDAAGAFAIDGYWPPGALRVRADTNLHFAAAVPLAAPGQYLRVRIDRNGILRGRVLLPGFVPDGAVTLTMRPFDETLRETATRQTQLQNRRGDFVLEPLRPGRFDLLVTLRNLPEPLAVVPDVFVLPGATDEPRLSPLDLSDALFRYRLRAVDPSGEPMALDGPIHARLFAADGRVADAGFRWRGGRAELITAQPLVELTFFGRGFEPLRAQFGPGEHDVWLRPLQPALVQVPGARALCGPTRKVRISVVLQGDTGYPASLGGIDQRTGERFGFPRWDLGRSSGAWLERDDVVSIPLLRPGRYDVVLRAHATDSVETPQVSVSLGSHELPLDGTVVVVPVDAQAVVDALQRVDQQFQQRLAQQQQQPPTSSRAGRGRGDRPR